MGGLQAVFPPTVTPVSLLSLFPLPRNWGSLAPQSAAHTQFPSWVQPKALWGEASTDPSCLRLRPVAGAEHTGGCSGSQTRRLGEGMGRVGPQPPG